MGGKRTWIITQTITRNLAVERNDLRQEGQNNRSDAMEIYNNKRYELYEYFSKG